MTTSSDELSALRAENTFLREQLAAQPEPSRVGPSRRGWARAIPAAALITIGAILAPVAVVTTWVDREVTSTDAFVATFAPLARDEAVRSFVAVKTADSIDDRLDVAGLTGTAFDSLGQLDLPPRAKQALGALEAPATAGIENLISTTVQRFVASDQFSELWARLLRTGHAQVVASLSGDRHAAVRIGEDGAITLQLGPVVAEVKQRLVSRGLTFATRIPAVNRSIVIATSDAAVRAQTAYTLVQITAAWLPWLAIALMGIGVVVARRRARALALGAIGVAVAMLVTLLAIAVARVVVVRALAPDLMPRNAARAIFDSVAAFAASSAVAGVVLGLAVAVVAWFGGSSGAAVRLRHGYLQAAGIGRDWAASHGVSTGIFGAQLYRARVVVRVLVAIGASAVILFHRPLEPGLIVWTLAGALAVVALLELVASPPAIEATVSPTSDDPVNVTAV